MTNRRRYDPIEEEAPIVPIVTHPSDRRPNEQDSRDSSREAVSLRTRLGRIEITLFTRRSTQQ
ncbi:hypothetical protein [Haladaptatus caseinilyticus]|uniref:hypothetical protein n=1 Tax=Haladaptatus caseinilyticus TaxID=2993314 RepID=UPI00224B8035|nr:hypothetical protein [Haladaptatus caseinilyticus]